MPALNVKLEIRKFQPESLQHSWTTAMDTALPNGRTIPCDQALAHLSAKCRAYSWIAGWTRGLVKVGSGAGATSLCNFSLVVLTKSCNSK